MPDASETGSPADSPKNTRLPAYTLAWETPPGPFPGPNGPSVAGARLLLLSESTTLTGATFNFLERHGNQATLLGGTAALSEDVSRSTCLALR
ncbi:MAG: hypothetical protein ACNA8W_11250 [Bradymonadaceae bacterium]